MFDATVGGATLSVKGGVGVDFADIKEELDKPQTLLDRLWDVYHKLRRAKWAIEEWWQRLTIGYAYVEAWNLTEYIARYALPRIKHLRRNGPAGCPIGMEHEEGQAILDDIIYALDVMVRDNFEDYDTVTQEERDDMYSEDGRYNRGCELFGKHWRSLWD